MNRFRSAPRFRKSFGIAIARDNILYITEALLDPVVVVFSVWIVASMYEGGLKPPYLILSVILFSLTFPSSSKITLTAGEVVSNTFVNWVFISGLLVAFGLATGYLSYFPAAAILSWLLMTPVMMLMAIFALRPLQDCSLWFDLRPPQSLSRLSSAAALVQGASGSPEPVDGVILPPRF